ncbi:hypothetical protein C4D60_Mb04t19900 [Musa balbisiana]|uniref:Isopenicillin N synthase-like Fe(2+) 2OG dioxygenase domain-containing protein n=1 Tax=Musa balbisiana TaxID=52838 RepID=A0A4S8KD86_MUSBA|nr:hypothetical protein C4D60_Mb04t19900 [Musa balbisiana]
MATTTTKPMRAQSHRFRAPPPTPIATGKGLRSAAVDDRVLSEYLDGSLRVPDLTLPGSYYPSRSPLKVPPEVDLTSLVSGDELVIRKVLAAASEVGAVRVACGETSLVEEARAAIEAGAPLFATSEADKNKGELGQRWFGRRDGVGEEFYWYRLRSPDTERLLQRMWPNSYRMLRDKMENVAARMETVGECIAKILSEHVASQTPSKRIGKVQSVLCLRKYESHHSRNNMRELSDPKSLHSHALSLHISGYDEDFCIRRSEGSAIFGMPAGDILVTFGKPLQEWCNGEIKSASGEILFQPTDDSSPSFSIEYMCSPLVLSHEPACGAKTISLVDQLLVMLVLAVLYKIWSWIFS